MAELSVRADSVAAPALDDAAVVDLVRERRRHLERMISDAGLGSAATRRRLRALLAQAPTAVDAARRDLAAEFWDHGHLDVVVQMAHDRVRMLLRVIDGAP